MPTKKNILYISLAFGLNLLILMGIYNGARASNHTCVKVTPWSSRPGRRHELLKIMQYIQEDRDVAADVRDGIVRSIQLSVMTDPYGFEHEGEKSKDVSEVQDKRKQESIPFSNKTPERLEQGQLLKVMSYIEKERDVDSVFRDPFVDRIWQKMKSDLVFELNKDEN